MLTDNDIIKAAKNCLSNSGNCVDCLYKEKGEYAVQCMAVLIKDLLSIISRQKAEIERFTRMEERWHRVLGLGGVDDD